LAKHGDGEKEVPEGVNPGRISPYCVDTHFQQPTPLEICLVFSPVLPKCPFERKMCLSGILEESFLEYPTLSQIP